MTLKYVKNIKGSADKGGAKNVTCKRSLKSVKALLFYVILSSDGESFVCDICHKHFSSREKLEDHELLHEDVKLRALDTQDQDQVGFVRSNCLQRC